MFIQPDSFAGHAVSLPQKDIELTSVPKSGQSNTFWRTSLQNFGVSLLYPKCSGFRAGGAFKLLKYSSRCRFEYVLALHSPKRLRSLVEENNILEVVQNDFLPFLKIRILPVRLKWSRKLDRY